MLHVKLDPEIEKQAMELAESKGISLDALVRDVLIDLIEEAEDVARLDEVYADPEATRTRPFDEVVRELDLEP